MKLLFLDIDGVLNSVQANSMFNKFRKDGKVPDHYRPFRSDEFCPICVSNLIDIVEKFDDLRIVVSSTWRIGTTVEELQTLLGNIGIPKERVIGKTPIMSGKERGNEIYDWLQENKHTQTKYAVLDDDSDMTMVWDCFFQTDNYVGLDYRVAEKVINHFKEDNSAAPSKKAQLIAS